MVFPRTKQIKKKLVLMTKPKCKMAMSVEKKRKW